MGKYGVMRVEKRKRSAVLGLQLEANRTQADHAKGRDFDASDIDWSQTDKNIVLVHSKCWNKDISKLLRQANVKAKVDSVVALDGLYTASKEWMDTHTPEQVKEFFLDCLAFHKAHYGPVVNAVIHMDEETPHLHVLSVPLVQNEQGKTVLSAKRLMGERGDYHRRQNEFYKSVCRDRGLDRGEVHGQTKKHQTKREWQKQQALKQMEAAKTMRDNLLQKMYPQIADCLLSEFMDSHRISRQDRPNGLTVREWFNEWAVQKVQAMQAKYNDVGDFSQDLTDYLTKQDFDDEREI